MEMQAPQKFCIIYIGFNFDNGIKIYFVASLKVDLGMVSHSKNAPMEFSSPILLYLNP